MKRFMLLALLSGYAALLSPRALAQDELQEAKFKRSDIVVIVKKNVRLGTSGNRRTLKEGTKVIITRVRGNRVSVAVKIDGKKLSGTIKITDIDFPPKVEPKKTEDGDSENKPLDLEPDDPKAIKALEDLGARLYVEEADVDGAGTDGLRKADAEKIVLEVSFNGLDFDSDALKLLAGLHNVERLQIHGTQIDDAGLKHLAVLTRLTHLSISESPKITDAGLTSLKELKSLQSLSLFAMNIHDKGLENLKDLVHLKELDLGNTKVAGKGLKHLKAMKELRRLSLSQCEELTNSGLKDISDLKNLQTLDLSRTKITKVRASDFSGMQELNQIILFAVEMSDKQVKTLDKALPDVDIRFNYQKPPED